MGYKATPDFSLEEFSKANIRRCIHPEAFDCGKQPTEYWALAITEEAGEIAGAIKKLMRGFNKRELKKMQNKWLKKFQFPDGTIQQDMPSERDFETMWYHEKNRALIEECADIYIYLDLFAQRLDQNLWEAIRDKFNKVSEEMGLPKEGENKNRFYIDKK